MVIISGLESERLFQRSSGVPTSKATEDCFVKGRRGVLSDHKNSAENRNFRDFRGSVGQQAGGYREAFGKVFFYGFEKSKKSLTGGVCFSVRSLCVLFPVPRNGNRRTFL